MVVQKGTPLITTNDMGSKIVHYTQKKYPSHPESQLQKRDLTRNYKHMASNQGGVRGEKEKEKRKKRRTYYTFNITPQTLHPHLYGKMKEVFEHC